jgi:hypothetical protein
MDSALKILTLAARIAIAWTLLSLVSTAFWVVLLEVGRRFGSRPASKRAARQEQQLSAEVRAIYADLGDDERACSEAIVHSEPEETAESDVIVLMVGTASARER